MKLITRQLLAELAASRWHSQYHRDGEWRTVVSGNAKIIHDKLLDIGMHPSPDGVDAAIGNDSWTRVQCDCCNQEVDRAVSVDVTYGKYGTHICEKCVDKMKAMFT